MTDNNLLFLPHDIQQILRRKSSRDPSSRFSTKLHILLNFVQNSNDKDMEEKVGCAWVTDEEFRLNKRIITNILGIKLNTLNVNLHALGFIQQKHSKDGWTLWKRPNFTRNSLGSDLTPSAHMAPRPDATTANVGNVDPNIQKFTPTYDMVFQGQYTAPTMIQPQMIQPIQLGKVTQIIYNTFMNTSKQIWEELGNMNFDPVDSTTFIQKAAARFKQIEQPLDNAIDVLKAIITPDQNQTLITFKQFCSFLAMFGPEGSIMLKIASLLLCSNSTGQWLCFNKMDPLYIQMKFYGQFDENEPNCLNLNHVGISKTRVWNLPLTSANEPYIIDEGNNAYESWDQYFSVNPVPKYY